VSHVAILFWFYKDLPLCRSRLDVLRRANPDTPIFGLYGGPADDQERFRDALAPLVDDYWAFETSATAKWKWRHGDLMLTAWHEARGQHLEWTHVFVAQWDMLVLAPVATLVPELGERDVLLSGIRRVETIANDWVWVQGGHGDDYRAFVDAMESQFGSVDPICCLFVIACLPRALLESYRDLAAPTVGYVEYRLPTVASVYGFRIVEDDRYPSWGPSSSVEGRPSGRERLVNGTRHPVRLPRILLEVARPSGARVFHPYHGIFPGTPYWALVSPLWAAYVGARSLRTAVMARVKRFRTHLWPGLRTRLSRGGAGRVLRAMKKPFAPSSGAGSGRDDLLAALPQNAVGVEIGVWRGDFSQQLLARLNPRELYLVDPWEFAPQFPGAMYGGTMATTQDDMDAIHAEVAQRFAPEVAVGRVIIARDRSADAAKGFAPNTFDFIYIDGNHSYEAVRDDLTAWAPLLKRNGVLAGDDYRVGGWWKDGVVRAVDEFARSGDWSCEIFGSQFLLRRSPNN
jgi:hypothetical protein